MSPALSLWLQFGLCAALIAAAGSRLSRYGNIIAKETGFSGTWVGILMLATVTSLPELVAGLSAVALAQAPNLAVGEILGSCVFNLSILVVLDLLHRQESVYRRASQSHILSAGFGVMLIGLTGFGLILSARGELPAFGHVGIYSPFIFALYVLAMRTIFYYEHRQMEESTEKADKIPGEMSLRHAVIGYSLAGVVVVGAGVWLPFIGAALAELMGWGTTFVGTLLVAFATSAPELVVTLAALRLGALDMAIGNLLGSNLFNIAILALADVAFLQGPLLAHVSPLHGVSALSAVMMSGLTIVALLYRPKARLLKTVGWTSLFLFLIYLLNSCILYLYRE
ncbi:MAG: sodium:calcium antiporter [Acidobacteriota bacterium]